MRKVINLTWAFLLIALLIQSCQSLETEDVVVNSPDGKLVLKFSLDKAGQPTYSLDFQGQEVIARSSLGIELSDGDLREGFHLVNSETGSVNETWEQPWGESQYVADNFNDIKIFLEQVNGGLELQLHFKIYNDGIGFRYLVPEQEGLAGPVEILDEYTEFKLTGDHTAWWIPADWEIYEHLWTKSKVSDVDAGSKRDNQYLAQSYIPDPDAVNTPLTMKSDDGYYLSIHEASLLNYSDMTLHVDKSSLTLSSALVAWDDGVKVKTSIPFQTPWRTVQVAEKAGDLIESNLIINLNEPSKIEDVSWIRPGKYVGIWWEMHLGVSSWAMEGGLHGATTENTKKYIDFAAENGFDAVLIEGWNTGWEEWVGDDREGIFDFVTPYPDFDLTEIAMYARSKGVGIVGHHETSGDVGTYEKQMEAAYNLYKDHGIHHVKSGYVGTIIPEKNYHHGQWMVEHYQRAVEKAAQYEICVIAHEPIKATGLRRTWPNMLAREGLRGQEFNAWSDGNPPEHTVVLPFTRMLGGPIDFTPGIFNIKLAKLTGEVGMFENREDMFDQEANHKPENQIPTTLAKQLALYITIYSPVQMAADLPQHYEPFMDAFQFIKDVPVNWQESIVLGAEIEEFLTIARKDRNSENWFLGSITNRDARQLEIALEFLDEGSAYKATVYEDGPDAHWDDNPLSYEIKEMDVKKGDILTIKLAPGGGMAISFMKTN